jgi:deoxyguanosine kinase
LVDSEQDYENLIDQVARCTSGRHYYNPLPVKEK